MNSSRLIHTLRPAHNDRVIALAYNYYGNRIATASSDQRLKVFEHQHDTWELVDAWRAHDGEITDVKWNGPLIGSVLGSIGEDCTFKLWQEDVSQAPQTSRRFKLIQGPLPSKSALPWVSLDFKNIGAETHLALISYDGNFTIMEPKDHDNLSGEWSDWMENQDFWVSDPIPHRSQDTSFRVAFHHDKYPCWTAVAAGLDRRSLSIAVAAMNVVRVFRTDANRHLYIAAELQGSDSTIRDISWANGSVRGCDVIATATKDNTIRIYELRTLAVCEEQREIKEHESGNSGDSSSGTAQRKIRNAPSGIGARLAGAAGVVGNKNEHDTIPGRVKQNAELVAQISVHDGNIWRIHFSPNGDMLTSSGDNATVHNYKRGINNEWHEFSQLGFHKGRKSP